MAMMKRKFTLLEDMNIADTTKITYGWYMRDLFNWAKNETGTPWRNLKSEEGFLKLSDNNLQLMLEMFLQHLKMRVKKNEISPNSIPKYFKPYKLLLDSNYREHAVKWKPISIMYPKKEKRSGYKPWKTSQVEEMLRKCDKFKKESAISFQASTGSRVGVHNHPLLMKHMIKMDGKDLVGLKDAPDYPYDYHCYAVLIYAEADESVEEKDQRNINDDNDDQDYSFFVFLTPEAAVLLDKYHNERQVKFGEIFTEDTPIFGAMDKHRFSKNPAAYQMSGNACRKMVQSILDNTEIKRIKKRNRFDTMIDHGFRKRFNTVLKLDDNVNGNIAEKLMQHMRGLDGSYLKPTRQECFKEFVKAIPELTVDPKERQKIIIAQQDKELHEKDFVIQENIIIKEKLKKLEKKQMQQEEVTRQQVLDIMKEQAKSKTS